LPRDPFLGDFGLFFQKNARIEVDERGKRRKRANGKIFSTVNNIENMPSDRQQWTWRKISGRGLS